MDDTSTIVLYHWVFITKHIRLISRKYVRVNMAKQNFLQSMVQTMKYLKYQC